VLRDGEQVVVHLRGHLVQRRARDTAGVRDDPVDAPHRLDRFCHSGYDLRFVRHVDTLAVNAPRTHLAQLLGRLLVLVGAATPHHDVTAALGDAARKPEAEATVRPGDQSHLAGEVEEVRCRQVNPSLRRRPTLRERMRSRSRAIGSR
jgi:hypothetical protein